MKKIYAITLTLLISLNISACGSAEVYETEEFSNLAFGSIILYEKEIKLPAEIRDFIDLGFMPEKDYGNIDGLSGNENDYKTLVHSNGSKIKVYVANYLVEPTPFENCYAVALLIEPNELKNLENNSDGIVFPKGIGTDISYTSLVEIYGEPAYTSKSGSIEYYSYFGSSSAPYALSDFANTYKNEIIFGFKGSALREVQIIIDVFE